MRLRCALPFSPSVHLTVRKPNRKMITIEHSPKIKADIIGFDVNAARLIVPCVQREYDRIDKKCDLYYDIREGGEMTERQSDKMLKYEELRDALRAVLEELKSFSR